MIRSALFAIGLLTAVSVHAQDATDRTGKASSAEIKAQVNAMLAAMKPGQTFMWRALLTDGSHPAAIEIWKAAGRPAIHTTEAEYFTVIQGSGELVTGGTMVKPHTVREGFIDGDAIEGGTSRKLNAGDVVLIPAGVPHGFGIPGEPLILLGIKVPPVTAAAK
jgi:mannose-6-phosphate isomerase-like protein (cupin superfamily)